MKKYTKVSTIIEIISGIILLILIFMMSVLFNAVFLGQATFGKRWLVYVHLAMLLYGGIFKAGDYIRKTGEGLYVAAFSLRVTYKL